MIDFAAALYGLGKKEAAVQLAQDFGLSYEDCHGGQPKWENSDFQNGEKRRDGSLCTG